MTLPGMPRRQRRVPKASAAIPRQWSGPIPGQTVMHQSELGRESTGVTTSEVTAGVDPEQHHARRGSLTADSHGFIQQPVNVNKPDPDVATAYLYASHGGSNLTGRVREFWDSQTTHSVRSDTPIHTNQSDTHTNRSGAAQWLHKKLSEGGEIKTPTWLVKDQGRLYALDGHHRIAAARQAGLEKFPAKIWDRDAETGWKP